MYSVIPANPPFKGSLDHESTTKDLLRAVKTKKTELLFVASYLRLLKTGRRAPVVVPDGVLLRSSNVHKFLRTNLIEVQKLDAVISMTIDVFKPCAEISAFTKTNLGGKQSVQHKNKY